MYNFIFIILCVYICVRFEIIRLHYILSKAIFKHTNVVLCIVCSVCE